MGYDKYPFFFYVARTLPIITRTFSAMKNIWVHRVTTTFETGQNSIVHLLARYIIAIAMIYRQTCCITMYVCPRISVCFMTCSFFIFFLSTHLFSKAIAPRIPNITLKKANIVMRSLTLLYTSAVFDELRFV